MILSRQETRNLVELLTNLLVKSTPQVSPEDRCISRPSDYQKLTELRDELKNISEITDQLAPLNDESRPAESQTYITLETGMRYPQKQGGGPSCHGPSNG